jgi:hypothetical protein
MAGVGIPPNNGFMADLLEDTRNRPVVFQTRAEPGQNRLRPHVRMLAGATLVVAALAGAAGITFGGSALWSVLGNSDAPNNNTAPLWLPPPKGVTTPQERGEHTATVDRDSTAITNPTTSHHPSATHVPGADDPPNHEATESEHAATTAPNTATAAPTEDHSEPEPTDDHHRGAGGGGPHGGGSSGHG